MDLEGVDINSIDLEALLAEAYRRGQEDAMSSSEKPDSPPRSKKTMAIMSSPVGVRRRDDEDVPTTTKKIKVTTPKAPLSPRLNDVDMSFGVLNVSLLPGANEGEMQMEDECATIIPTPTADTTVYHDVEPVTSKTPAWLEFDEGVAQDANTSTVLPHLSPLPPTRTTPRIEDTSKAPVDSGYRTPAKLTPGSRAQLQPHSAHRDDHHRHSPIVSTTPAADTKAVDVHMATGSVESDDTYTAHCRRAAFMAELGQADYILRPSTAGEVVPPPNPAAATSHLKVLVIGNSKCGKSSLIERYVSGSFNEEYRTTIGADYRKKAVSMCDGSTSLLQLWDIAGQDRFVRLTRPYYRGARAAVVVCDISREVTFTAARAWKQELDALFALDTPEARHAFPVVLLMNKCDLLDKSASELLRMGQALERMKVECGFTAAFTTSAKESRCVTECMEFVVNCLFERDKAARTQRSKAGEKDEDMAELDQLLQRASEQAKVVDLNKPVSKRSGGCCY